MPNEDRNEKRPYVKKVAEVVPVTAADFKQYIGEIVNNRYNGCYAEVVAVVDEWVIVRNRPGKAPESVPPNHLCLNFDCN